MPQLTPSEKFKVLLENVSAYPFFLLLFLLPVVIYLLRKKKLNRKILIVYLAVGSVLSIIARNSILKVLDNFIEYIITILTFPPMGVIFLTVIISFVIAMVSAIRNYRLSFKIINILSFVSIQIIFGVLMLRISKYKVDFTKEDFLFSNLDIVILMQFITGTFTLQLFLLFLIKSINFVTNRLERQREADVIKKDEDERIVKKEELETVIPVTDILKMQANKILSSSIFNSKEKPIILGSSKEDIQFQNTISGIKETKEKERVKKRPDFNFLKVKEKPIVLGSPKEDIQIQNNILELNKPKENNLNIDNEIINNREEKQSEVNKVEIPKENKHEQINIDLPPINEDKELTEQELLKKIAFTLNKIDNQLLDDEEKLKMKMELLEYKKRLLEIKEKEAKKQAHNLSNMFNLTREDFK